MNLEVRQEELDHLPAHGEVAIAFTARSVLELTVALGGLGGFILSERELPAPFVKDYDRVAGRPADWRNEFDTKNWALFSAWIDDQRAGGIVIASRTEGLDLLERRQDLAVIWDLRVAPNARRLGVGGALFAAAESWAGAHGCSQLKVETQNINVAACRFYARHGCTLGGINRFAYPLLLREVQLIWYKNLIEPE